MTEQQMAKLAGALVEHQKHFASLSGKDAQWAIQNTQAAIALCVEAISGRKKEISTNPIIHIDRTIHPTYPEWFKGLVKPELELAGPPEFDVSKFELWLHPDQVKGVAKGDVIFEYLKQNQMLESCLNLRDLEEIQKQGSDFFRRYFQSKAVFAWKSVARDRLGNLDVPYLFGSGGLVVVDWHWLGSGWGAGDPALRFASPRPLKPKT